MSIFQTAEEVSFAANGITADGLKAFDGILQSNVALKTLDLSGNAFGDEGAKVTSYGACLACILLELIYSKKHKLHQTLKREKSAFKVERQKDLSLEASHFRLLRKVSYSLSSSCAKQAHCYTCLLGDNLILFKA